MCRANAIEFRQRQLAPVGTATPENDIAPAKSELSPNDIASLSPPANMKVARVQVIEPDIDFVRRVGRLDPLVHAFRERPEQQALPPLRSNNGSFTQSRLTLNAVTGFIG